MYEDLTERIEYAGEPEGMQTAYKRSYRIRPGEYWLGGDEEGSSRWNVTADNMGTLPLWVIKSVGILVNSEMVN